MSAKKVNAELLLGRLVRDPEGVRLGRIVAIEVERDGDDTVVREYRLGSTALLAVFGISARDFIGWRSDAKPVRVPWDQMDISDPSRPRLLCPAAEITGKKG